MGRIELSCETECPHCGNESYLTGEFRTENGDQSGIDSGQYESQCYECDKKFWYSLRLNFEVEVLEITEKKPKGLRVK